MRESMRALRVAREAVGLSLAKVAGEVGISHVFLAECELGNKPLAMKHWAKLAEAISQPTLFVANACVDAGPVRVDASKIDEEERMALVALLASFAERCST